MNFTVTGGNAGANITLEQKEENGILLVQIKMELAEEATPEEFIVSWESPIIDSFSLWNPATYQRRTLHCNWAHKEIYGRLASNMPLQAIVSADSKNRMTAAISDTKIPTTIGFGVTEETACFDCAAHFFTQPTNARKDFEATLRIDTRDIPFYDAIYDVSRWWEADFGYKPAFVPDAAKLPMYSTWYSFHQQVDVEEIVKQCALAKELGMETVIVDDGWQTADNSRGYAYCGDWEPTPEKVPDMRAFVDAVHTVGMKFMLWYSVPFIGKYTKAFAEFRDMLLCDDPDAVGWAPIDPRYPKAREYLISLYENAMREWDLDGFKLDFIDSFALTERTMQPDSRRDTESLEEGVDRLMKGVKSRLTAIKPDVLIEFRQSYVGPSIREYGNMLRVGDCPNDAYANRESIVDLRLTSGETAVHSDMLMWHYEDTVEAAALQVAGTIFSVPQISVRIDKLPVSHYNMLRFYLAFIRENRDVLLNGKLTAKGPEVGYHRACAEKDGKAVLALYHDTVVREVFDELTVVNVSGEDQFIFCGYNGRKYKVYNCMGELLVKGKFEKKGPTDVYIPRAGMLVVE